MKGMRRSRHDTPIQTGHEEVVEKEDTHATSSDTIVNSSLWSLVVPWMLIALVSICAAIILSLPSPSSSSKDAVVVGIPNDETTMWNSNWMASSTTPFWFGNEDVSSNNRNLVNDATPKKIYDEEHAPLFPLTTSDYIGLIFATIGLMIAAGGGIGGGGILVPIYILVLGFSPKHAIPLSNITVFAGALANALLNATKRHPLADRPLVDWDLILVMEPLTIAGALIGAFLNKLLPERLLVVLLVALLSFTAYQSLKKAVKMYKAETRKMRAEGIRSDGTKESELTRMAIKGDTENIAGANTELLKNADFHDDDDENSDDASDEESSTQKPKSIDPELLQILEEEKSAPFFNLSLLISLFVVILVINILKGGGAFRSPLGIRCGSNGFWMSNLAMLAAIIITSLYVRSYLVQRYHVKQRVGYQYVEGDIKWDSRATLVYPCICCLAGFFAGMFGIGGGIVKGPLMLAMGVHPAVSSASSACMILFTSFTATTSFLVFGLVVFDYALAVFVLGFLATLLGQVSLSYLMKKSGRNSYIVFSIGGVVLISAFLMTIQSLLSLAEGERHHSGGICGKDD